MFADDTDLFASDGQNDVSLWMQEKQLFFSPAVAAWSQEWKDTTNLDVLHIWV